MELSRTISFMDWEIGDAALKTIRELGLVFGACGCFCALTFRDELSHENSMGISNNPPAFSML